MELTDSDKKHIARLQALRDTGAVNMFTDVRRGLVELYGEDDAQATYEWITDNFEYYRSGEWTDVDVAVTEDERS